MTTHNYKLALSSAPARYKAKKGGNKELVNSCEKNRYDNEYLLSKEYIKHNSNNKLNKHIMATKNLLASGLGVNVMKGVRSRMFNDFCESLCASLASSASASCGVGRITYAALIATWRKDTSNGAFSLNESEGRKLYNSDNNDSRVRRVGVDGHWSFFVSPFAKDLANETDSISVLVGAWLRSWSSWYDSVIRYGHYGIGGVPAGSCVSADLLNRCKSLWSFRGVGGRTAKTDEEKQQDKINKAISGLDAASLLTALRASGVDLSALAALAAGGAPVNNNQD